MNTLPEHAPDHPRPHRYALVRTVVVFAVVGLAWLALATFLPNFHLGHATMPARVAFVGVVLLLLGLILAAQVVMLRTWFRSLAETRPDRVRQVIQLRTVIFVLLAVGVLAGVAVLAYATINWMPRVQEAVSSGGEPGQHGQ